MLDRIPPLAAGIPAHDVGVRQIAALSARLGYVLMCFTLCWGVLTTTGWVQRSTGRAGLRNSHMVLATLTLAFSVIHAASFWFLDEGGFGLVRLTVPLADGGLPRHSLGIIGLELMIVVAVTVGLRRWLTYRRWLRVHQLAYLAVALTVVHSWLGAAANGHLALLRLAGITVLVPTATMAALRFLPARYLVRIGLLDPAPLGQRGGFAYGAENRGAENRAAENRGEDRAGGKLRISVNNEKCHRYGICQAEAPDLFRLVGEDRLSYHQRPDHSQLKQARAAARSCPMRAIELRERSR